MCTMFSFSDLQRIAAEVEIYANQIADSNYFDATDEMEGVFFGEERLLTVNFSVKKMYNATTGWVGFFFDITGIDVCDCEYNNYWQMDRGDISIIKDMLNEKYYAYCDMLGKIWDDIRTTINERRAAV